MSDTLYKIVKLRVGGLDIHKNYFVAAVCITDPVTLSPRIETREFNGFNCDLDEMCEWFLSYGVTDVCMESTGKYWIPVVNKLEEHEISRKLVHPKYVKNVLGHKTDKADAQFIAHMHACDMTGPGSVILPMRFQQLRGLARRYWKLGQEITAEKNRFQNCLTVSNLPIDAIFTDPFGKSAQAVIQEVLNNDNVSDDRILSLVHKRCKNKNQILDAVHGANIKEDERVKIADISLHIQELNSHKSTVFNQMMAILEPYLGTKIIYMTSIPGISVLSAMLITSEIGVDMSFWKDGRQLTAWAGLTPRNDQSHGKKKSTRITKAGQYLKPLLVQCALSAIRCKDNPYYRIKYNRLRKRRGHKKAVIAIARMLLIAVFNVLSKEVKFEPIDFEEVLNPKKKAKKISKEEAIAVLQSYGIDTSSLRLSQDISPPAAPTNLSTA